MSHQHHLLHSPIKFHLASAYNLLQANMHVSAHVSAQILVMEQILGLCEFCDLNKEKLNEAPGHSLLKAPSWLVINVAQLTFRPHTALAHSDQVMDHLMAAYRKMKAL